jgi:two-component system cell cycle sensor histidine kinase/response regulator CckA
VINSSHRPTGEPPPPAVEITVLVAEDEPAVLSLVKHLLAREGYRVIAATSGVEAVKLWARHKDEITILLTDIVMPGRLDGHQLASQLRAEKASLRVITMSGYDPSEYMNHSVRPRVNAPHVRKPFTAAELIRAIDSTSGHVG